MAWQIVLTPPAERDMAGMPKADRDRLEQDLDSLLPDPYKANIAKLQGRPGEWRLRSGAWRAILELDKAGRRIVVTRVRQRKDAYRR